MNREQRPHLARTQPDFVGQVEDYAFSLQGTSVGKLSPEASFRILGRAISEIFLFTESADGAVPFNGDVKFSDLICLGHSRSSSSVRLPLASRPCSPVIVNQCPASRKGLGPMANSRPKLGIPALQTIKEEDYPKVLLLKRGACTDNRTTRPCIGRIGVASWSHSSEPERRGSVVCNRTTSSGSTCIMKRYEWFSFAMTALALTLLLGCQSASSGSGSSGDNGSGTGDANQNSDDGTGSGGDNSGDGDANENDNSADNSNDNGNDNDGGGDDQPELTQAQQEAVDAVVSSLASLAATLGAAAEAANPPSGGGSAGEFDCPAISFSDGAITLDYGDGCSPILYPDLTVSGSVSGEVSLQEQTIALTFEDFTVENDVINGTIDASFAREAGIITLEASIDLALDSDSAIVGDITVLIDEQTGEITITTGQVAISEGGTTYETTLTDVHFDPVGTGTILPDSGSASFELSDSSGTTEIAITFTQQTPVDLTVLVSVNGGPSIPVTLTDF